MTSINRTHIEPTTIIDGSMTGAFFGGLLGIPISLLAAIGVNQFAPTSNGFQNYSAVESRELKTFFVIESISIVAGGILGGAISAFQK